MHTAHLHMLVNSQLTFPKYLGSRFSGLQSLLNWKGRYKGRQSKSNLDKSIFSFFIDFKELNNLCSSVGDFKQNFISIIIWLKFRSNEVGRRWGFFPSFLERNNKFVTTFPLAF